MTNALARVLIFSIMSILSGCGGTDNGGARSTNPQNINQSPPDRVVPPAPNPPVVSAYPSCLSSDVNKICIGLKVISYIDSNQVPVITEANTLKMISEMNEVWSTCNIAFQLEVFEAIDPTKVGLVYHPNWNTQSTKIRKAFQDTTRFLIVGVGSLGGSTIAVTQMPGVGPFGVLVEKNFAANSLTVGHELGHYMGIYHIKNTSNLMNPYIGPNTRALSSSQCSIARKTNTSNWAAMKRIPAGMVASNP